MVYLNIKTRVVCETCDYKEAEFLTEPLKMESFEHPRVAERPWRRSPCSLRSLAPSGGISLVANDALRQGMPQLQRLSVQAKRGLVHGERLVYAESIAWQVNRVTNNGETEAPKMNANLVSSTSQWSGLEKRRAIIERAEELKTRARGRPVCVNDSNSVRSGLGADRSIAFESLVIWMTEDTRKICFAYLTSFKLRLNELSKLSSLREDDHAGGVRIKTVSRARFQRSIYLFQKV